MSTCGPPTPTSIRQIRRRLLPCLLLATAACAVGGEPSGTGLTYYEGADPASLDPALSNDVQSGEVVTLLFDNLVQFDTEGRAHRHRQARPAGGPGQHPVSESRL